MQHLYGLIQGNKGVVSCNGTKSSGLNALLRGVHSNIKVTFRTINDQEHIFIHSVTADKPKQIFHSINGEPQS